MEELSKRSPQKSENLCLLACSGGSDSLSLLLLFRKFLDLSQNNNQNNNQNNSNDKKNLKVVCAHFNHRWSPSSQKAKNLVRAFCKRLQFEFFCAESARVGKTNETFARQERYSFLFSLARKLGKQNNSITSIWTAHQKEDQVETFFLRLLRGSSPSGLKSIAPFSKRNNCFLVRPLLEISKLKLRSFLSEQKIDYFVDQSNFDLSISRNLLREKIFPQLELIQKNFGEKILELVQILQAEDQFLEEYLGEVDQERFSSQELFRREKIAIQRLILKKLLQRQKLSLSFKRLEHLRSKILESNFYQEQLSQRKFFVLKEKCFQLKVCQDNSQKVREKIITTQFKAEDFWDKKFTIKLNIEPKKLVCKIVPLVKKHSELEFKQFSSTAFVDFSSYKKNNPNFFLEIRQRKAGDFFRPVNCKYKLKLKNFLINRKESALKKSLLLVEKNSQEVLWILGYEVSDQIKVRSGQSSSHFLEIY